ncbi:antibiotic biosynthesis monooxygenase [Patulibacter brassicae]|jgi:quinol monooxygenase YgiN|uniref:Antibiotic biosynthesis monooxygenase n=1 Tax=Patulibacter brassicae TaxID=1705717 RepID=A0ABU4VLE2_9ACTN|nr:antibiotic biosynthesis monooxygenase [Patulibacter brassicae]MDX8152177.1 antibiotic biosynthesis monooxygenase [Patulibacter brassicae]
MSQNVGILALLHAKAGKGEELRSFLEAGRALAVKEEGTVNWYAFQVDELTFGIFDTFADDSGRDAHLNGEIAKGLGTITPELLDGDPDLRKVDLVAVK